jgi:hypothetical protein
MMRDQEFNRICPVLSAVAGWCSFIPGLGLVLGPAAVYFSIRARRLRRGGCLATMGLVLGIVGFLAQFGYLSQ